MAEEEVFVVEKILDRYKDSEGGLFYLIKWLNYPDEDNTWEPEANLSCPEKVTEFEANYVEKNQKDKTAEKVKPASPSDDPSPMEHDDSPRSREESSDQSFSGPTHIEDISVAQSGGSGDTCVRETRNRSAKKRASQEIADTLKPGSSRIRTYSKAKLDKRSASPVRQVSTTRSSRSNDAKKSALSESSSEESQSAPSQNSSKQIDARPRLIDLQNSKSSEPVTEQPAVDQPPANPSTATKSQPLNSSSGSNVAKVTPSFAAPQKIKTESVTVMLPKNPTKFLATYSDIEHNGFKKGLVFKKILAATEIAHDKHFLTEFEGDVIEIIPSPVFRKFASDHLLDYCLSRIQILKEF